MPRATRPETKGIRISMLLTQRQKEWLEYQTQQGSFLNQSDIIRNLINQAMKRKPIKDD